MSDMVLPCPFCGGDAAIVSPLGAGNIRAVECRNTECASTGPWGKNEAEAIATWNTRAAMQADADLERIKQERDQAVEALKTTNAWLDRWARHIGDCPGIDDCTCGLTRVRYEARAALGDSLHNSKGEEYND